MEGDTRFLDAPVHVWGDGEMNLLLRDLVIAGSFKLRPALSTSGGLLMYAFNVEVELGSIKSTTSGFMGSKLFSKVFDELVQEFIELLINDSPDEINYALENLIVPPANKALKSVSIVQLLGLILGLAGENAIPTEPKC